VWVKSHIDVPEMTYKVSSGTLNSAHSLTHIDVRTLRLPHLSDHSVILVSDSMHAAVSVSVSNW